MTNVIAFPKSKKNTPPQTIEEILDTVETNRKDHVDMFIDQMAPFVFSRAYEEGIDLSQDHCNKTSALMVESLKAALYKAYGIYHPLHEFAESAFDVQNFSIDESEDVDIISDSE